MKTNTVLLILFALVVYSPTQAQWSNSGNNHTTGKVAIGTGSTTLDELYIYGSNSQQLLKVENSRNSDAGIEFKSNLANFKIGAGIGSGTNSFTVFDINASQIRMMVNSTGQVGIGTSSPSSGYKLDVNGSLKVSGHISTTDNIYAGDIFADEVDGFKGDFFNLYYDNIYSSSDKRLKKNIVEDYSSFDKIYDLKTYSYQFKNDKSNRNRFGVMAQEIVEVLPDLVSERENGHLAVNYVDMIPLMIRALQDQKQTIDALQSELNSLKKSITNNKELADLIELEGEYIKVYPNPSNANVKIELSGELNNSKIELINLNGDILKSINPNGNRVLNLDNPSLIDGVYFIRYFLNGNLKQTKRILIQK